MGDSPVQQEAPTPSADPAQPSPALVALRVAGLYVAVASAWIFGSDRALSFFFSQQLQSELQTVKGLAFVILTGAGLFLLVRSYLVAFHRGQEKLNRRVNTIAEQYQHLFQDNPFPMWVYDQSTLMIVAVNERALEAYGFSRDEFLAMKITDMHGSDESSRLMELAHAPTEGTRFSGVWKQRKKNGGYIEAEVVSHWIDFDGRRARLVMSIDVTERLKAQRALEEYRAGLERRVSERTAALTAANDRLSSEVDRRQRIESALVAARQAAEAANAAKSTYLANTTHEIRTPLTSILGYSDLLRDGELGSEQRQRYVDVVRQNATHLLQLVDDLLDLTRAEMGKISLTWEQESPAELAAQAIELVRPKASDKKLELVLDVGHELPAAFRTDGVRLRQILLNLLANAIKFTESGRVSMSVEVVGPAGGGTVRSVRFAVADTGIGIQGEYLERIFEPFYQVDQAPGRRYRGVGLGLAISRELAVQMGGTLHVDSTVGKGSRFAVDFPLTDAAPVTVRPTTVMAVDRFDGCVLLAEDDPNIRWLVEEFLRRAGAEVISTSDGAAALAHYAHARDSGARMPDLVVMDIHMPGMDGLEAMARLRAAGYAGPLVALTAHAQEDEEERCRAAGCDAIAAKPIDRATFIPMLAGLTARHRGRGGRTAADA